MKSHLSPDVKRRLLVSFCTLFCSGLALLITLAPAAGA